MMCSDRSGGVLDRGGSLCQCSTLVRRDPSASALRSLRYAPPACRSASSSLEDDSFDVTAFERQLRAMLRLAIAVSIVAWTQDARPCSPMLFSAVSPSSGVVPSNLPGLDIFGCGETPHLFREGDDEPVPLLDGGGGRFLFAMPLVEGERYRVEHCGEVGSFAAGPAGVWSGYAGQLAAIVAPRHIGRVNGGPACTQSADIVSATFLFQSHPQFDPWLDHVDFTLTVVPADGGPERNWTPPIRDAYAADRALPPADWRTRTAFEVYAVCAGQVEVHGLSTGVYLATLHARMPGSEEIAVTDTISFELDCSESSESEMDVAENLETSKSDQGSAPDEGCVEGGASLLAFLVLAARWLLGLRLTPAA